MATLIYSPGIRVVIETAGKNGIIDVSEDLASGQMVLREEAPSQFSFVLLNHRRKYDGVFTPNDIIHVDMKRRNWVPVFSGYLDQVPFYSVYARNVTITATDSLKRLKYHPWDPGTAASTSLMMKAQAGGLGNDGGMRDVMIAMLHNVGKWNLRNIHIAQLPQDFLDLTEPLRQKVLDDMQGSTPGQHGTSGGADVADKASGGQRVVPRMETEDETSNTAITGVLGANTVRATSIWTSPRSRETMSLTGESLAAPKDEWYCRMRFPYSPDGVTKPQGVSDNDFVKAKKWWKNAPLLVTNPTTLTSVVLRAADWGGEDDQSLGVSEHVLRTVLNATEGATLDVRFAPLTFTPGQIFSKEDRAADALLKTTDPGGGGDPGSMDLPWQAADGLLANTNAARAFIKANWDVPYGIGGYRAGDTHEAGHSTGQALDCMMAPGGTPASGNGLKTGNGIALWFAENPHVFDSVYVIWQDKIISGTHGDAGWRDYGDQGSVTANHMDHVHLSFDDSGLTSAGPMGGGWANADIFNGNVDSGGGLDPGGTTTGTSGTTSALNFNWTPHPSVASQVLTGYRALMNDVPLLSSIDKVAKASMRSYMAAPNGDFISWFPDYFGAYGTAAVMNIRDIELASDAFTMMWDDSRMVTHQYAVGSLTGISNAPDDPAASASDLYEMIITQGIASVEFPELMAALFNIDKNDPRAKSFLNPDAILQRFGARPNVAGLGVVASPAMEFWYACRMFQKNWAAQFSSKVQLTFMPEMWPGMLMRMNTFGFQAYVEQVVHTFDFIGGMGGGFRTEVSIIAPSSIKGGGLFGLPKADANVGGGGSEGSSDGTGSTGTSGGGR